SAAFVHSRTVASNRSGCLSKRFNRKAAGTRRFTFCRNRTGSIESRPLSIPLKKNETIQQQKMMNHTIMLQPRTQSFSAGELPRSVSARFDVEGDIVPRQRVAKDLFHDVVHGDDPCGAAKFVNDHCHSLRMSQKKLEQLESVHRLWNKRGSDEFFGVMFRRIEQKQF